MVVRLNALTAAVLTLNLAACTATAPPAKSTGSFTLCRSDGCTERPHGYTSFDPTKQTPEEAANARKMAELEALAEKDPSAAYDLALRLFRGDGVPQSNYQSVQWMRKAAENGYFEAQKALGRLYLVGLGEMGADPGEAEKWLSITASRGDTEAYPLLQQAQQARNSNQNQYRWYNLWQSSYYSYWYNSPYYWRWNNGGWYYYP